MKKRIKIEKTKKIKKRHRCELACKGKVRKYYECGKDGIKKRWFYLCKDHIGFSTNVAAATGCAPSRCTPRRG